MFQIDPLNSSYSQKVQYPKTTVSSESHPCQSIEWLQFLMWYCQINRK